ncbi:EpsG family protein [Limosilactobacillus reuteri]|uniref:EpsG family protein n=1 Tax=Limosilactobacillus reuteri TaxID=1598 RepID=UPI0015DE6A69|nr:EpsG family protein [Limosilactobacillus reuteri]QLL76158.1 hypothetical protein GTO86_06155 [Limosilactobacillus reuteri]
MTIYLIIFAISVILFFFSEKVKVSFFERILVLLGLIAPSLLAGMRSLYVGTDVLTYVYPLFHIAESSSSYLQYLNMPALNGGILQTVSSYEYGYTFLTYVVAKLTGSFQFLQFFIEFFILSFIYLGIRRLKIDNMPIWFCMLTYYLLFFNNSLNMVRQWMAMSILLYGFKYIKEQKLTKFIITILFAYLFHSTAIIGLLLYLLYWIIKVSSKRSLVFNSYSDNSLSVTAVSFILLVFFSCAVILLINRLYPLLGTLGLSKYSYYLSGDFSFSINQFILKVPILLIISLNINEIFKKDSKIYFYLILVLDVIASQLASLSDYSIRMSIYLAMFNIYGYAILSESNNRVKMFVIRFLIIIYLLIYWYYTYCVKGNDQTVPYVFF